MNPKKPLLLAMLASATLVANQARAVTYVELGDAGQTPATVQSTGVNATTALTGISGNLSSPLDADLFAITLTATSTFSAIASSATGIDTSLFLFNSAFVPVIANDDSSNTSFQAGIPAGNSLLTTLAAGTYYLAISLSGNEAVNLNNQQLFTVDQPTTNVRGIASGLNPTALSTFNGQTFFNESGAYNIALTSTATAVPEPTAVASLLVGAVAAGSAFIRRKRVSAV